MLDYATISEVGNRNLNEDYVGTAKKTKDIVLWCATDLVGMVRAMLLLTSLQMFLSNNLIFVIHMMASFSPLFYWLKSD